MYPMLTTCPVCSNELHVTRLTCGTCATTIDGTFSAGPFARLAREQLEFVELLVKNRGNINSVATDLDIAYNTARARLDDIVKALGYGVPADDQRVARRTVLDKLAAKEISVDEAMRLLKR